MNINIIDDSRDLLIKKDIEIKTLFYALKQSQGELLAAKAVELPS